MFDPIQMQGLIRYANRVRIKDEDLAQHSYSVAFYCFTIAEEFGISYEDRNKAIAMAIIHDIGEVYTSDLPHDVKYDNPELKELCDKLECNYIYKNIPEVYELWNELEDKQNKTIPSIMVKLADSMSVKAYAERELSLGNRTFEMEEILVNAKDRIDKQIDILNRRLGK